VEKLTFNKYIIDLLIWSYEVIVQYNGENDANDFKFLNIDNTWHALNYNI